MKIAIASSGLGHVTRGIEAWAADLGRALVDRGHDVRLYKGGGRAEASFERVVPCCQRDSAWARRLLGVLPRQALWRIGFGSGYALEQTSFALALLPHLAADRIDILHVQDPDVARIAQWAHRLGLIRARTILAHGTEEPPAFLQRITYLQHLAPWHLEEARRAGAWKPTWTAIPNFIDTVHFRPGRSAALRAELGIPDAAPVVLTTAAIRRGHKRIDHLIGEFARLRAARPDVGAYLVVAGGREAETEDLLAEGRRLLGDRVRFLVSFPRERMAELYRAADLFVLCSLKEMMPIALLEATASGLPCLTHRHPVLGWIIGPGGVMLDMATPGELAATLNKLLSDAQRRARLGAAARRHCDGQFSRERVVDQIDNYYPFVLSHPAARARGERRDEPRLSLAS
jgi:glycosyltransferase involved in cell wall biosynthesis